MLVIQASTPNSGLAQALKLAEFPHLTKATGSRNGPVLRFNRPVTTMWTNPIDRIMWSPVRDCNPFLHLIESAWMLAGRNDVATVAKLAAQMNAYTDDGSTLNGAYGHRWRNHFGFDQIALLIKELRANRETRRIVLQMWDGQHDLKDAVKGSKDVPCLSADTVIRSPEGNLTIKELALRFKSGKITNYPVYSVDFATDGWPVKISSCTAAWKTARKKTFKITLDDGSSIRATDNHRFFVKTRRGNPTRVSAVETEVRNLHVGDILCAGIFRDDGKYKSLKKQLQGNTAFSNFVYEHKFYYEHVNGPLEDGYSVHHQNEDKHDNCIRNLEAMTEAEHMSQHRTENNPHLNMTQKEKVARGEKHSKSLTLWVEETRAEHGSDFIRLLKVPFNSLTKKEQRRVEAYYAQREEEKNDRISAGKDNQKSAIADMARREKRKPILKKIVSIEACGVEDVYDFTVPKLHNAILENGVVTHNCNTAIYFDPIDDQLHMTVSNRSNDAVWGCYGANLVHMSILQEYVARLTGFEVGNYYQMSNNLHFYTENEVTKKLLHFNPETKYAESKYNETTQSLDDYKMLVNYGFESSLEGETLFHDLDSEDVDGIIATLLNRQIDAFVNGTTYEDGGPYFMQLVGEMMNGFNKYKKHGPNVAVETLEDCGLHSQWILAAILWLKRRPSYKAESGDDHQD